MNGIPRGNQPELSKIVQLYEERGETSRIITAEIREDGNLQVSGYDVGKDPLSLFDDSDYEFWLTLGADQKDHLLLAFINKCFGGRPSAVDEFRDFVKSLNLPFTWMTW